MNTIWKDWLKRKEAKVTEKALAWLKTKPKEQQANWLLKLFGLTKVPMLASCRPHVEVLDDSKCTVKIPLNYWTKNHLGSLYFGALCIGAEATAGFVAMAEILIHGFEIDLVFKSVQAEFLKRPVADTFFETLDVPAIKKLVETTHLTGERQEIPVTVTATSQVKGNKETVATFTLILSLKSRKSAPKPRAKRNKSTN